MVAQLSDVAVRAAVLAKKALAPDVRKDAIDILDKVAARLEIIDEYVGVLEVHADMILECMNEDENAYFINDSKLAPLTVTSMIKKRCRTIRVQKVVVGQAGQRAPFIQDNENQRLTDCDGSLACRIDERISGRKASSV
ncbi:hypothetical protein ADL19_13550 [Streptomyces purpurogeneiscleroticus]|nr:hypothetical protein ADL19_13550 [Streptomyces purpurogeneiscleroticus]